MMGGEPGSGAPAGMSVFHTEEVTIHRCAAAFADPNFPLPEDSVGDGQVHSAGPTSAVIEASPADRAEGNVVGPARRGSERREFA
jgi:hypothetical protein